MSWPLAIALWGALLSTVLAVREVLLSQRRIYFEVVHNHLLVGGVQPVLLPPDDDRGGADVIVIQVYNRGRDPIYLHAVGLRSQYGGHLVPVQHAELRQLPTKLDPSDGFTLVAQPASLVAALAGKGSTVDTIDRVYCVDGAGRIYVRQLNRRERGAISAAARAATS